MAWCSVKSTGTSLPLLALMKRRHWIGGYSYRKRQSWRPCYTCI